MRSRIRSRERIGWLALALAIAGVASADEPAKWLERMNHALTTLNYDGTLAHWQGGKVEMLRIVHRVKDGTVSERLVSLDGSGREFIRTGSKLVCYLPDKRVVLVERTPAKAASLLGGVPVLNAQTARFYDIKDIAHMRFDGHNTHLITVVPRDQYRYGYRLWIEDSTAMPLKTQLCNGQGKVIEQIVFTSLEIRRHIPDSAFRPDISTAGFRWLRNDSTPAKATTTAPSGMVWSADRLPPGFHMAVRAAQTMPGKPGPVDHLVFTDGLASVSVFVETHAEATPGRPPVVESARVGSSYAFSTVVDGHKVTAVGEAPPQTVRFIADSVREEKASAAVPPPDSLGQLPPGPFAHSPQPPP